MINLLPLLVQENITFQHSNAHFSIKVIPLNEISQLKYRFEYN